MKYPRTYHLPWSPGTTSDDKIQNDLSSFLGKNIVITEKMDGENTTMTSEKCHARSEDSNNHPSRNWVKGLWGNIRHEIPEGWRICGENLYAKHSIHYQDLPSYFLVFSIWNENNECLSWEDTKEWCRLLGLETVFVLWEGKFNQSLLEKFHEDNIDTNYQEGYVVRNSNSFHFNVFSKNVVKWVREGHVQTDKHWSTQPLNKNLLK